MIVLVYRPEEILLFTLLDVWSATSDNIGSSVCLPASVMPEAHRRRLVRTSRDEEGTLVEVYLTRLGRRELQRFIAWRDEEWQPFTKESA